MHFFLSNQTEYVYLHRIMLFLIKKENMKNESKLFYLLRISFIFLLYPFSVSLFAVWAYTSWRQGILSSERCNLVSQIYKK